GMFGNPFPTEDPRYQAWEKVSLRCAELDALQTAMLFAGPIPTTSEEFINVVCARDCARFDLFAGAFRHIIPAVDAYVMMLDALINVQVREGVETAPDVVNKKRLGSFLRFRLHGRREYHRAQALNAMCIKLAGAPSEDKQEHPMKTWKDVEISF